MAAAELSELPVAPTSARVDLELPSFSNPTEITNPLFPISELRSAVFSGRVEGEPFHTETTLLPQTRTIEWSPGKTVETRVSQYFAYIDGRIEEVANDYYAQADDGSVWYFGEDLFDYERSGFVDSTEGAWLAGVDGPPAMIMPGDPQVGQAHRAENIPGVAFEEVRIKTVDKTVPGPTGPVEGAMVARELHDDATFSDKVFAPGYGEFFSGHGPEVEAMALAVPADAAGGAPPPELERLAPAADQAFGAVRAGDWQSAAAAERDAAGAWDAYRQGVVPPRIGLEMDRGLALLGRGIEGRDQVQAGDGAIDVAQSALDLELRYRDPAEIDFERFGQWARQVQVDAQGEELGFVRGDVTTMEWIRDRFVQTLDPADVTRIDVGLRELRDAVVEKDLAAVAEVSAALERQLAGISLEPQRQPQ